MLSPGVYDRTRFVPIRHLRLYNSICKKLDIIKPIRDYIMPWRLYNSVMNWPYPCKRFFIADIYSKNLGFPLKWLKNFLIHRNGGVLMLAILLIVLTMGATMKDWRLYTNQVVAHFPAAPNLMILQQETETPTGTHTGTVTPTPSSSASLTASITLTSTSTLTITASPTHTITPTPSPSTSPTFSSTFSTITMTQLAPSPTLTLASFETESSTPENVPGIITATTTLIPLPAITFQFPQTTQTTALLVVQHPPDSADLPKGGMFPLGRKILRWWPILVIFTLWLVLGFWFVLIQSHLERH